MKLILAILSISSLFLQSISGQQELKGIVTDNMKSALPGVSVLVKGTFRGTLTDINGSYAITALPSDTLVFSMIGMLTIKGDALTKQITSNPMQALQGKVAGVQIINNGIPGGGSSVKIRGVGSIGDYAKPLYVVDGVFVDNIDFLSSGDIDELTVLKDASASAIYGVRAANGVILVTTRKGKTEKPTISYDGYFGVQVPVNIMPMSSRDQYVTLLNEANANIPGYVMKVVCLNSIVLT